MEVDTFDGSKPQLVSYDTIRDIEERLNIPFEESNRVLNGLGTFYSDYMQPNLFPIIIVSIMFIYLFIKYVLKQDREERELEDYIEGRDTKKHHKTSSSTSSSAHKKSAKSHRSENNGHRDEKDNKRRQSDQKNEQNEDNERKKDSNHGDDDGNNDEGGRESKTKRDNKKPKNKDQNKEHKERDVADFISDDYILTVTEDYDPNLGIPTNEQMGGQMGGQMSGIDAAARLVLGT